MQYNCLLSVHVIPGPVNNKTDIIIDFNNGLVNVEILFTKIKKCFRSIFGILYFVTYTYNKFSIITCK